MLFHDAGVLEEHETSQANADAQEHSNFKIHKHHNICYNVMPP